MSLNPSSLRTLLDRLPGADRLAALGALVRYVARRIITDSCLQSASSLTYTSLLGLVPLLAMFLAILSGFPAFHETREEVKSLILAPLVPEAGEMIREHIDRFLANTRELTGIGIAGLAITSILLLNTIVSALNRIWRVKESRPFYVRILAFWAILTLTPVLTATSITLSRELSSFAGTDAGLAWLGTIGGFAVQTLFFIIIFLVIPNRRVRVTHATIGGLTSSLLFEGLKVGFGLYFEVAQVYQVMYGALAAIPIFLLWLYLSWMVVLLGAEIAAALPEWQATRRRHETVVLSAGETVLLAVGLLRALWQAQQDGRRLARDDLKTLLPGVAGEVDEVLAKLDQSGYVAEASDGWLVLIADLTERDLYRLQSDLGFAQVVGDDFSGRFTCDDGLAALEHSVVRQLGAAEDAKYRVLQTPLKDLSGTCPKETAGVRLSRSDRRPLQP